MRIFKTGSTRIVEAPNMEGKPIEEVQVLLAAQYPEVKNALIKTGTDADGNVLVEFLPQPGRKG